MRHSIYYRNFLANALIVLLSFSVLGGLSTVLNYRISTADKKQTMASTLRETRRYVTAQHLFNNVQLDDLNLSMGLAWIAGASGLDFLVTDTSGVISSCSDMDFRYLGMVIPESILELAAEDGVILMSSLGHIYNERRQVACAPISARINGESHIFGYVFVSSEMGEFRQGWRQFTGVFSLIAISVMAFTYVISFITTKKMAIPLAEMASAARRFERGDFSTRVDDPGRSDEISRLTHAFNSMADSLESSETLRREFIANISHELKTPMTIIAGFADGILDGTVPPEDEKRYLSVISSETRRLSRLISSMLEMSKLQSIDSEAILRNSFDISELVLLSLFSLEAKIEDKHLDVETSLPEDQIMTRGDKDSITQVLYNLIDNAVKFSLDGGVIRISLWKQGDHAYVSVENGGETIPPDELPDIFNRFHKIDKSRGINRDGVGLGLYIVKTILDSHNEDIFVTSADGVTKFMFTLSLARL